MRDRRGSVYLAAVGTVAAVTALSLTGVALRKSFHDRARIGVESADAHRMARSASELAIHTALNDSDAFVDAAPTGSVFDGIKLGSGTISAAVTDADTDGTASSATTRFRVVADANTGRARSRLAFTLERSEDPFTTLARDLGAIAYWPLDEATGSSVAEDVIGGYDGAYIDPNCAGVDTHVHGNASPKNDWITQYTRVPHDPAFVLAEATIGFWAYVDYLPILGNQQGLIGKELPASDGSAFLSVYLDTSDKIVVELQDKGNEGEVIEATGVVDAGTWHYITVTWDNKLRLYVDGKKEAQSSNTQIGLDSSGGVADNTAPWTFGVRNIEVLWTQPAFPAFGSVARVVVFDRELNPADIKDLCDTSTTPGPLELEPGSFARVVD
ncbi:MAG: LamG domain-containing protein [Planctomycetota bacterium]